MTAPRGQEWHRLWGTLVPRLPKPGAKIELLFKDQKVVEAQFVPEDDGAYKWYTKDHQGRWVHLNTRTSSMPMEWRYC